jgi:hypothetical protein
MGFGLGTAIGAATGGALGGVTGGGVGALVGSLYDKNHSGGGSASAAAPAPWTAQSEYGANPNKDWYYNQENSYRNATGQGWTKDQYGLAQAQYASDQNRNKNLSNVSAWEQSRNPYYASLYQQMQGDQNKQSQQSYADSLKRMQLQSAARGTLGGSQSEYNKSLLNSQLAQQQAQNAQQAQNYVQGLRQNDQQQAQQLRQQAYAPDPYIQKYYESLLQQQGNQSQAYKNQAAMQMQALQDQQAYQNNMSQIYGGQIGTLGNFASAGIGML